MFQEHLPLLNLFLSNQLIFISYTNPLEIIVVRTHFLFHNHNKIFIVINNLRSSWLQTAATAYCPTYYLAVTRTSKRNSHSIRTWDVRLSIIHSEHHLRKFNNERCVEEENEGGTCDRRALLAHCRINIFLFSIRRRFDGESILVWRHDMTTNLPKYMSTHCEWGGGQKTSLTRAISNRSSNSLIYWYSIYRQRRTSTARYYVCVLVPSLFPPTYQLHAQTDIHSKIASRVRSKCL